MTAATATTAAQDDGARATVLRACKPGEYIRRKADAKKTYRRGAYDASSRTYTLLDCDDICRSIQLKGNALVFVGFTY